MQSFNEYNEHQNSLGDHSNILGNFKSLNEPLADEDPETDMQRLEAVLKRLISNK